ncbi:MAG: bifunctional metallophosphatase/5'-nucleotidase [Acidobacteria bacterium]|nr:bifunctional metallophosphatase/5'-nucleotidase [Acidobacteriota bacterium]
MRPSRIALVCAAAFLVSAVAAQPRAQAPAATVDVQILAINDFHGALEPASGANGRLSNTDVGGVEYLSTHLSRLRAANPNTVVVSAGDNIGATPLLSSLSHDEATIDALNRAGLQISAVGNHELDEGWWELRRMQNGGCHPVDGCVAAPPFAGARFTYLAANITLDPRQADPDVIARSDVQGTGTRPLFPPFVIREVGGVRVGFIGLTLEDAPTIIIPASVRGLTFSDEARAANDAAAALRKMGVRAIVVVMHQGGEQSGGINGCTNMSASLRNLVTRMSRDIDVVVSGHSHQAYNCTIGNKLVTSASSNGRLVTDIDLRVSRSDGEVVSKSARNLLVDRTVPKDPEESAIIARYSPIAEKIGGRVVGTIAGSLMRTQDAAGESPLGRVLADAMLDGARQARVGDVDIAFWNSGGIRADLVAPAGTTPTPITYAQLFSVLPFGNELIVKTLTGAALLRVLEEQFGEGRTRVLPVSAGFTYTYNLARPRGQRVDPASVQIGGARLDPARRYRVATSNFLWGGGDDVSALGAGTDPVTIGVDVDIVSAYFARRSPVRSDPPARIRKLP